MCNRGTVLSDTKGKPTAILFINSNKAESNILKKVAAVRKTCILHDIILGDEAVVSKGPDRDIDREAVNILISLLMRGKYQIVIVDRLTDITDDVSDLEEFLKDAAESGVSVIELSYMEDASFSFQDTCPEIPTLGSVIVMRA